MAESFTKITVDNEVETLEEVQIKISEPQTKEETISVQGLRDRFAREKVLRDGYIASIAKMEAQLAKAETEAGKVVLKKKVAVLK